MKDDALNKPFFASLLEAQKKTNPDLQCIWPTSKLFDQAQTQKYPSDGDDDIPPIEF